MIGTLPTNTLDAAVISGVAHSGLTVTTRDGRPARLAILDDAGRVIADGAEVARECWNVAIECHRNFWQGNGHMVVHTSPTGLVTGQATAKPKARARR